MNERAKAVLAKTKPTSFCCNVEKWLTVMEKYENGGTYSHRNDPKSNSICTQPTHYALMHDIGFMYYTTLPTDSLTEFHKTMLETKGKSVQLQC